jgi:hypothetical protein
MNFERIRKRVEDLTIDEYLKDHDPPPGIIAELKKTIDSLREQVGIIIDAAEVAFRIQNDFNSLSMPARKELLEFLNACYEKDLAKENATRSETAATPPTEPGVGDDIAIISEKKMPPLPPQNVRLYLKRVPMAEHRKKLIEFLRGKERCTRSEMASATGIPEGSISALLASGEDFEQVERGLWKLKEGK